MREGMREAATKDRLVENEVATCRDVLGSSFFIMDGEPLWRSDRIALMLDHPGQGA